MAWYNWIEDDGTGHLDQGDGGSPADTWYYAHHPLVEALSTLPAGVVMPTDSAGVTLQLNFDPANRHQPTYYPLGIPLGANVTTEWGDVTRMCAATRFSVFYKSFMTC